MTNFKVNIVACGIFLLFVYLKSAIAQRFLPGPCRNISKVNNFDFKAYIGPWYEVERYRRESEDGEQCVVFLMHDTEDQYSSTDNSEHVWPITRLFVKDYKNYKFTANALINEETGEGETVDGYRFQIIGTDYEEYAVIYACSRWDDWHEDMVWILTRQNFTDDNTIRKGRGILRKNDLAWGKLQLTRQYHCPENWDDARTFKPKKKTL